MRCGSVVIKSVVATLNVQKQLRQQEQLQWPSNAACDILKGTVHKVTRFFGRCESNILLHWHQHLEHAVHSVEGACLDVQHPNRTVVAGRQKLAAGAVPHPTERAHVLAVGGEHRDAVERICGAGSQRRS